MAHRTKKGQEIHDRKVAELAKGLQKRGYRVEADLPGHSRPPSLGGTRPDVVAKKGSKVLVREVETPSSLMWSKNLSPFLEGLARGEFQLTSFKIAMIKERPPKMNNPAVSNSFSSSGASDFTPPPGGNT